MNEVLYVKYNRTRCKGFQTKVTIEDAGGLLRVRKSPLAPEAACHVKRLDESYRSFSDYYNGISLVEYHMEGVDAICPFVKGTSLSDIIRENSGSYEDLVSEIKDKARLITDVNDKFIRNFKVTPEFEEIFGRPFGIDDYKDKAFSVCNLDSIFDNFIMEDGGLVAIDYEWMMEVTLPVDFVIYRALKMFYIKNTGILPEGLSLDRFCLDCGISDSMFYVFEYMDDEFQQYVHGPGREAIYTDRYLKRVTGYRELFDLPRQLKLAGNHIGNLEASIKALEEQNAALNNNLVIFSDQMGKYRKALYNPFYAFYRLMKKAGKKVLPERYVKGLKVLKDEGSDVFKYKVKQYKSRALDYETWISRLEAERHNELISKEYAHKPLISVLVPVYNVSPDLLKDCLDSVIDQSYENWELCVVDDCSTNQETLEALKRYENNPKIKLEYRSENGHISRCTNRALSLATGDFVALLDCDDVLSPDALLEVVNALNVNPEALFIYSDEDKIDETGKHRFAPYFKPDWAPDTLMSLMYTCHLGVFQKSVIDSLGGLRPGYEGSQDYDLVLRVTEKIDWKYIIHIPQILYHWRTRKESTAADISAKPYILEATKKAKEDAFCRRGISAVTEYVEETKQFRVRYIPGKDSFVSIIIPSKDNPGVLERLLKSLREKTVFTRFEIIIVDNGSSPENKAAYSGLCRQFGCNYIYTPMEFNFSRMCNIGAAHSRGGYILFLNDDMEVIEGEWLDRMLGQAQQPHTGAVGAKLLYPGTTNIQHVGVLNLAPGPSHALGRLDDNAVHYFGINKNDTNFLAVTAACLMVSREKFNEVGGFDEDLKVAYNDVDFCFKLVEAGYYNVTRTDVILYHHESFSRGLDTIDEAKNSRLIAEREKLYRKHPSFSLSEHMDPFYNHRLVQDNIDYSYNLQGINYDRVLDFKKVDISTYVKAEDITFKSEICIVNKDNIYISGWAYKEGYRKNGSAPVTLIFTDEEGRSFAYEARKMYRPDVRDRLGGRETALIGYMLNTKAKRDLTRCRIGLAIGRYYTYIDEQS